MSDMMSVDDTSKANDADGYKGPLSGLKVLDFGHYFAGPMAGMLMADQGATVIKIVPPGENELPEHQYRLLNRNKKVLSLDLKNKQDREKALALIAAADIVIENFRPGVMANLGLSYADIKNSNPSLIYLSLPGFSAKDQQRAHIQAWEGVLCAATSLYAMDPLRNKFEFPPHYMNIAPCSAFGAMHGVVAVLAALESRSAHGGGHCIEVPLAAAGLSTCTRGFIYSGADIRSGLDDLSGDELPEAAKSFAYDPDDSPDVYAQKLATVRQFMPQNFVTNGYRSKDGRYMMFMPIKAEMSGRFFDAMGLSETLTKEGFVIESPWDAIPQPGVKNLADVWGLAPENNARVIELIQGVASTMTAEQCQQLMLDARIPFSYVRSRDEWMAIPELKRSGMFVDMGEGDQRISVSGRTVDVTGPGNKKMSSIEPGAFQEPVETSWENLQDSFISDSSAGDQSTSSSSTIANIEKGAMLSGVKVLDLCNVVAGPNAAYTLAQYGAEVIRVEPPRSFNLPMHLGWTLEVNQGKRSMVLDIKTEAGRQVFERLVGWADIVVHNRLDEVAERLGMAATQLKAINPQLIVCQASAFGTPEESSWTAMPGYDPNPNMTSGLEAARGSVESPSIMMEIFTDLMGGLSLAYSCLLALYQRSQTGYAGEGSTSLARGCNYFQLPQLIAKDGVLIDSGTEQSTGWFALGESPCQRLYACADQWVFAGAAVSDRERFLQTVAGDEQVTDSQLEQAFAAQPAQHWVDKLNAAGFGCHTVMCMDKICHAEKPRVVDNHAAMQQSESTFDVVCFKDHPCGIPIVLPLPSWVRCGENLSYLKLSTTPKVGQDTKTILVELGYSEADIVNLYSDNITWDYLPAIGNRENYFFVPKTATNQ